MAQRRKKVDKQRKALNILIYILSILLILGVAVLIFLPAPAEKPPEAETEGIPANEYNDSSFFRKDGFLRYAGSNSKIGIDVSAHQGVIDWKQVKEAGVEFAVIRAGYRGSTKGLIYEDEQFRYNAEQAELYGIPYGVYFYSQALNTAEAEEEASQVNLWLSSFHPSLPVFFDWEEGDGTGRISSASAVDLTACSIAFCEAVEAAGHEAGVYFNLTNAYHHMDMTQLQDYTLWLAEYNEVPTYKYHYDWVQFTDSGTVPGIEGTVDLDLMIAPEATSDSFVVVQ